ncbi:hypothetical protein GCM10017621_00270 [Maricaulis virginensis]|uniref:Uncharacterized protein n=2 Tax=Maricaulis virginensis TaxID=144022 RepID=A0A9W6MM70_9PROT|nr:hypothetical protein GCM10017621_00270 [Maricaulis virginensis]
MRDPLSATIDQELGGITWFHILRLTWLSLLEQAEAETGAKDCRFAIHRAMDKLDGSIVAAIIFSAINAPHAVVLERQIYEGAYIGPDAHLRRHTALELVSEYSNARVSDAVKGCLSGYTFDPSVL